jgi:hypothetical protein
VFDHDVSPEGKGSSQMAMETPSDVPFELSHYCASMLTPSVRFICTCHWKLGG